MRIGLYKNEYGIREYYREFPCCEINIDEMTSGTDYYLYADGDELTIQGVPVAVKHFSLTQTGCAKIVNPITRESDLIMQPPFWNWNNDTEVRDWMGGHFTAQNFESAPNDWDTALYWKYYTYTHDTSYNAFDQWKTPTSTTFNPSTTYYTCDSEEYEPQKVYYGKTKYAPSFTIGQCLHNPPNGISISGVSSIIGGATYNGYMCGSSLGTGSGTDRTRIFAIKGAHEEYMGYARMHDYTDVYAICLHTFPTFDILTSNPAREKQYKHYWQMAHIIYDGREWIGWGEIKYNYSNPDEMQSADFTCTYIELYRDAIVPDTEPYESGTPAGNSGGQGGMGSGLPDGDNFGASESGGALTPLGAGLNAYIIDNANLGALSNYLWGAGFGSGGIWEKFQNYKFNPIAGILSLHHLPFELLPIYGNSVNVRLAGMVFDGVSSGGTTVTGLGITAENHVKVFDIDPVYLDHEHGQLPYFSFEDFAKTRVRVYLPYCGTVELDPAQCIGGKIEIKYQCDCINGNVGVQIVTTTIPPKNGGTPRRHVAAVATGNAAYQIPVTGNDNGTGEILGALKQAAMGAIGLASGNVGGILSPALSLGMGLEKHTTTISGSIAGNAGYLISRSVIIEVTYGDYYKTDENYPAQMLRPAASSGKVSDFTGHSQLIVHADSITLATDSERAEIEAACSSGVLV